MGRHIGAAEQEGCIPRVGRAKSADAAAASKAAVAGRRILLGACGTSLRKCAMARCAS